MEYLKKLVPYLIIALGLVGLGQAVKCGINNIAYKDRVVQVRGLAERTVPANRVVWPVSYSISGDELQALYAEAKAKNEALLGFLTSNGIPKSEISVNPPEVDNLTTDQWVSQNVRFNYKITMSMTVATSQVDKVRQLLDRQGELLDAGIAFNNSNITYSYSDLNKIKPEMIAEATKNARQAAERFAEDSGNGIGSIKSAEQGYFSIEDDDCSTPYIKRIRVVTNVAFYLSE